jgi:hypothetical protein
MRERGRGFGLFFFIGRAFSAMAFGLYGIGGCIMHMRVGLDFWKGWGLHAKMVGAKRLVLHRRVVLWIWHWRKKTRFCTALVVLIKEFQSANAGGLSVPIPSRYVPPSFHLSSHTSISCSSPHPINAPSHPSHPETQSPHSYPAAPETPS